MGALALWCKYYYLGKKENRNKRSAIAFNDSEFAEKSTDDEEKLISKI